MNDNNNMLEPENSGVTFGDIFRYLKKCFPMIIVGIIICCIIAAAIGGIIQLVRKPQNLVTGTINLTYAGAENGKNPDKKTNYDKLQIKNNEVIAAALEKEGLKEYTVDDIRNAIVINNIVPKIVTDSINNLKKNNKYTLEELEKLEYFPTSFAITLDLSKIKNMDDNTAGKLVDRIMETYIEKFSEDYIHSINFTEKDIINLKADYSEQIIELYTHINILKNYLTKLMKEDDTIYEDGNTFSSLLSNLKTKTEKLDSIYANVKQEGYAINSIKTLNYLKNKTETIDNTISLKTIHIEKLEENIKNYNYPDFSATDSSIEIPISQAVEQWGKEISTLSKEIETLGIEKKQYSDWYTKLKENTDANVNTTNDDIESDIKVLDTEIIKLTKEINKCSNAYYSSQINNTVKISSCATVNTTKDAVNWKMLFGIAVLVGFILGFPLTKAVAKKKAKKQI